MKKLLFPTIRLEYITEEARQRYKLLLQVKNSLAVIAIILFFCGITAALPLLTIKVGILKTFYLIPTISIAIFTIVSGITKKFLKYGIFLLFLTLQNLVLLTGVFLLFHQDKRLLLAGIVYYALLLLNFLWIVISYRGKYRNFEEIFIKKSEGATNNNWWKSIFIAALAVIISRFFVGTFSYGVIGAGTIFFACYTMSPLIAERLVILRQYDQFVV